MLKKLIGVIMVLVALGLIALFLDRSVFIIKDVRIEGESGMADDDVIRLAGVDFGGRIRSFDDEAVRRRVESTGQLKCTGVYTEMPSTVVISVEKRIPRLVADYGGSVALMDADGYVISTSREIPGDNYLYITGLSPRDAVPGRLIGADNRRIEALRGVVQAIDMNGCAEYISEINVSDVGSIHMFSRTGIKVLLGDVSNLGDKMMWAKYALIDLEIRGETSGKLDVTGGKQADYSAN